jgi:hypothetical protein
VEKPKSLAAKREKAERDRENYADFEAHSVPWQVRRRWLHPDEYGEPSMAEYKQWAHVLGKPRWKDDEDEDQAMDVEDMEDAADEPSGQLAPEPARKTLRSMIKKELEAAAGPNGNDKPSAPIEASSGGMSLGVKWALTAGCVGAFVLAVVKFGGRVV